jgi:hypothetical protein
MADEPEPRSVSSSSYFERQWFTTITVEKGTLRVRRGSLPLVQVERAAIVQGSEVGRLRDNMSVSLGPGGVLAPLGQLGQATAGLTVGYRQSSPRNAAAAWSRHHGCVRPW